MTIRTRITTLAITTIAAITLSSTHATAQPFIEIDVSGIMRWRLDLDKFLPYGLRVIFDTGAAPVFAGPDEVRFNAVWGEVVQTSDQTPSDSALHRPFRRLRHRSTSPHLLNYQLIE